MKCKLTKNLPILEGDWVFRIQGEDLTRGGENSGGVVFTQAHM